MTIPILPESAPFTPAQRAWLNGFFAGALGLSPAGPAVLPVSAAPAPAAPAKPAYDRKNPFAADVLKVARLTRPGSAKDVRFVSFDLRDGGLTYEVGDALGVYPENCPELVDAILNRLMANGDESVLTPAGQRTSAREALIHACTITKHHDALLELLANTATDPDEAARIKALAEG